MEWIHMCLLKLERAPVIVHCSEVKHWQLPSSVSLHFSAASEGTSP